MIKTQESPATCRAALSEAVALLAEAGIAEARLDGRLLLCQATGRSLEGLLADPERALSAAERQHFAGLVARRARREPLAHIRGSREFWSLPFRVTAATLVPRPASETLVEAALALVADRHAPLRVLDLGTGCGCLLLALLAELCAAVGIGVELSEPACRVARDNAAALGLASRAAFLVGNWHAALAGRFDLVLSNPPYVREGAIAELMPEVASFEPRAALSGGVDGLAAYRALAPGLQRLLAPGGRVVLELGAGQGDGVAGIMTEAGLQEKTRRMDLAGIERCLIMSAKPPAGE
ncbi:MAG: peptide chain release factor N(5)-glutamine methyltransferase [Alphaproteobacteria bacterium]